MNPERGKKSKVLPRLLERDVAEREAFLEEIGSRDEDLRNEVESLELRQDGAARQRLLREARSAAALDHPFICNVHEIGEVGEPDYIAMEYVRGRTLREELLEDRVSPARALQLADEIAQAVDKAHRSKACQLAHSWWCRF